MISFWLKRFELATMLLARNVYLIVSTMWMWFGLLWQCKYLLTAWKLFAAFKQIVPLAVKFGCTQRPIWTNSWSAHQLTAMQWISNINWLRLHCTSKPSRLVSRVFDPTVITCLHLKYLLRDWLCWQIVSFYVCESQVRLYLLGCQKS